MSWFKKESKDPVYNMNHPEVKPNVEFAFEAGPLLRKRKFYRMVKDFQMPTGRYKWVDAFLNEAELRMDLNTLNGYIDEIEKQIDGSKGVINLSKAHQVLWAIRSRSKLAFEPATIKRLASVVFFDESEDLSTYDKEYCDNKIKFWDQYGCYDFFLTTPIKELLQLPDGSEMYLKNYILQAELILKDLKGLTSEPENPS